MSEPRSRPDNLPKLGSLPDSPPISFPSAFDDESILKWCEGIRDHFEEKGFRVSVGQLRLLTEKSGISDEDQKAAKKIIKRLYASELGESQPAPEASSSQASEPAKKKKKKKKEKAAKPAKSSPKPKKEKVKMSKKNKKNGKKATAPAKRGGESVEIYNNTVKGVAVIVSRTAEGKFMASANETTFRKVAQWMGANGWVTAQAFAVLTRLLKGCKKIKAVLGGEEQTGPEIYVRAMLNEGHLGSGAHSKGKKKGSFGISPRLEETDPALAKALKRLRKTTAEAA